MPIIIIITNAGDKTGCGQVTGNKVLTNVGGGLHDFHMNHIPCK